MRNTVFIYSIARTDKLPFDEAHKARTSRGIGAKAGESNALLAFMLSLADRTEHLLLGTATPIQTQREDLWDLMRVLHRCSRGLCAGA